MSETSIMSANRLTDGLMVFLASSGEWVEDFHDAIVLQSKDDGDTAIATAASDEAANKIIAAELVKVDVTPKGPVPLHLRDQIRFGGPTFAREQSETSSAKSLNQENPFDPAI